LCIVDCGQETKEIASSLNRKLVVLIVFQFAFLDVYSTVTVNVSILDVNDNPPTPLHDRSLELYVCEDSEEETKVSIKQTLNCKRNFDIIANARGLIPLLDEL